MRRRSPLAALILLAGALLYGLYEVGVFRSPRLPVPSESPSPNRSPAAASGSQAVAEAFANRRSNVWVEASGSVERLLADDLHGSRHQRFLIELPGGHSLLVSHNIDLAPRVPLALGQIVELRGEYEWNEKGGLVHWTHHDPDNRRPGGWIRTAGRIYQ